MRIQRSSISLPLRVLTILFVTSQSTAKAYVRAVTKQSARTLRWHATNCLSVHPTNEPNNLNEAALNDVLSRVIREWNSALTTCSYLRLSLGTKAPHEELGFDLRGANKNVITFLTSHWPHDASAPAITKLFFIDNPTNPNDGVILDADIAVNEHGFTFATDGNSEHHDLQSVLTHEMGHLLGLAHTCDDGSRPLGEPSGRTTIPLCSDLTMVPSGFLETTMFNFGAKGETKKRTLEEDDVSGVCAIFPRDTDPGVCRSVTFSADAGGCAFTSGALRQPPVLLLVLFAFLVLQRTRRGEEKGTYRNRQL